METMSPSEIISGRRLARLRENVMRLPASVRIWIERRFAEITLPETFEVAPRDRLSAVPYGSVVIRYDPRAAVQYTPRSADTRRSERLTGTSFQSWPL
jgi:hypothetical protein